MRHIFIHDSDWRLDVHDTESATLYYKNEPRFFLSRTKINRGASHQGSFFQWTVYDRKRSKDLSLRIGATRAEAVARAMRSVGAADAKFTGTFFARTSKNKPVELTLTVEAPDAYLAGDKLKAAAEKKFGADLYFPVIRWKKGANKTLSSGSISLHIAQHAGAEED